MKRVRILLGIAVVAVLALAVPIWATQGGAKEQKVSASQLPAAVKQAIKTNCPNCTIAKARREVENGVAVYDVEFKTGQGEMDVAEDGSVIDRETVAQTKDLPAAALEAIRKGPRAAR